MARFDFGQYIGRTSRVSMTFAVVVASNLLYGALAVAQGTSGEPGATTTISGKQLPAPDPKFGGVIRENAAQSKAWWAPRIVPPKGAPNVLLIMTDDCGFGAPSTFGGVIPTPVLDRIAKAGLRYTCFHSTALCSPTRAALITDWTQTENVVAKNPRKLDELKQIFLQEARKYQVLPLDASVATRLVAPRPNITAGRAEFVYTRPLTGIPQGDSPLLMNCSYNITAEIDVPQEGAEGILLTSGGRFAGYGFYLLKGKPVFLWNLVDLKRIRWEGPEALAPGNHTVEFNFKYDGLGAATLAFNNMSGIGGSGTGVLKVDGKQVATQKMERTIPLILQWDETFDIGSDTGTPVNDEDYQVPFTFTGKLNKLTLKLDRPQLSPEDIKKLEAAMRNNRASE